MIDLYSAVTQAGTRDLWICPSSSTDQNQNEIRTKYEFNDNGLMLSRLETQEDFFCQMRVLSIGQMSRDAHLVLTKVPGLVGIARLIKEDYLIVVTSSIPITSSIYRIMSVRALAIGSSRLDGLLGVNSTTIEDIPTEGSTDFQALAIAKLLSSGSFYYQPNEISISEEFLWNGHLLQVTRQLENVLMKRESDFVHSLFFQVFQGFVGMRELSDGFVLSVTSLLSSKRAGTRYRSRGIDDDGNVANFVESDVSLRKEGSFEWSYRILRGSVPVFWDQAGFQLGYPRIQLTRSPTATQPAFNLHFDRLYNLYGTQHVLDLLSQREGQAEQLLSSAYTFHINSYNNHTESNETLEGRTDKHIIRKTAFDVHAICKGNDYSRLESLMPLIRDSIEEFSYSLRSLETDMTMEDQRGTFRVNCLDCLDRTNLVQGFIILRTLQNFLTSQNILLSQNVDRAWNSLWADNGDALSVIYTGTGAIRSSYTRSGKHTFSGLVDDVKKTAARFYVNNFIDPERQLSVDLLLGRQQGYQQAVLLFNPGSMALEAELKRRLVEYSHRETLRLYCVTWNCAGARPTDIDTLKPLFKFNDDQADMIVISLQEAVELNATQIVGGGDPENRIKWEQAFSACLEPHYSLLVGHQLVGTTLSVFCKPGYLSSSSTTEPVIRNVELASKKTGLGGMAGNKGSVAIRMEWLDSPICLVASHFAAGLEYWEERDREYQSLLVGLQFSKGKGLFVGMEDTVVIWMGDLNYRLDDLDRNQIEQSVTNKNFEALWPFDQLRQSMRDQRAFTGFHEAPLQFPPTYKYDPALDLYDSSEKQRPPAWTDRILGHPTDKTVIRQYGRIEDIRVSDHRAVYALIDVTIQRIDKEARNRIQFELISGKYAKPPLPPPKP